MNETKTRILEIAADLARSRGYNAFSFRDLSDRVGIKTASIHYHFATKGELCLALIEGHRADLAAALGRIDAGAADPAEKLRRYARVFRDSIRDGNRMCLCGMLSSDVETLPDEARVELKRAIEDHEVWLMGVLEAGRDSGLLRLDGSPRAEALSLFASLEGALLIARAYNDPSRFAAMAKTLLAKLGAAR